MMTKETREKGIDEFDYSDKTLRQEYEKKWEVIKILKSHYVAKENSKIILISARDFIVGKVRTTADAASYFYVFQQYGCFSKYALLKDGFTYAFVNFNKDKLFETFQNIEKNYKRFAEAYQKTHPEHPKPEPFDWKSVGQKNLLLAQSIIEITINYFELSSLNRLTDDNIIPFNKFEKEQIDRDDVYRVLNRIPNIQVKNDTLFRLLKVTQKSMRSSNNYVPEGLHSEQELRDFIYLKISSLEGLREINKLIDEKLNTNIASVANKNDKNVIEIQHADVRPFCVIDGKWGYLKFNKYGKKIKISGSGSQPFRLMECLTEPFGTAKMVDTVFEAIREGVKHKNKSGVYSSGIDKAKKITLIEFVIKEIQKGNKLQNKLEFKWDELKTKVWLVYMGQSIAE
jgi:hypothetical protein